MAQFWVYRFYVFDKKVAGISTFWATSRFAHISLHALSHITRKMALHVSVECQDHVCELWQNKVFDIGRWRFERVNKWKYLFSFMGRYISKNIYHVYTIYIPSHWTLSTYVSRWINNSPIINHCHYCGIFIMPLLMTWSVRPHHNWTSF